MPQGENVLDASMMAELIVTRKEIWPQLKKSTGHHAGHAEKPRRGWSTIAVRGKAMTEHSILWFLGSGLWRHLGWGFAASVRTPVEGKIRLTRRRGHRSLKANRKKGRAGKCQRDRDAGLNVACGVSAQPEVRAG